MSGFDEPEKAPRLLGAVTILLTAAAGALNVVTYFGFSQTFASTMSGNLVLFGLRIGQGEFGHALDNVVAIVGYCSGLIAGTLLCGWMMRRLPWRSAVGSTLTAELAVMVALGILLFTVEEDTPLDDWSLVILVVGSGLAMGVQAAVCRYIGPSGTPTSFLSGTVTNWVSGLVDRRSPNRRDWNSPLRIGAMIVAAAGNAVVQRYALEWAYAVPVALVLGAVVLMALVVRADHGGLWTGAAALPVTPRPSRTERPVGSAARP